MPRVLGLDYDLATQHLVCTFIIMLRLYLTFIDQTTVFCDKLTTSTNTYYMLCPTSSWTNYKSVQINVTILVCLLPGLALPSRDWIYASFKFKVLKILEAISMLVDKIARFLYWSTVVVMYKIKKNTPILTNIHVFSFLGYQCVVFSSQHWLKICI